MAASAVGVSGASGLHQICASCVSETITTHSAELQALGLLIDKVAAALRTSGMRVVDVFRSVDMDNSGDMDPSELQLHMKKVLKRSQAGSAHTVPIGFPTVCAVC